MEPGLPVMTGPMVFLTVGTTKFDALVAAADDPALADALADAGYTRLVMQVGCGEYKPHRLMPAAGAKTGRYTGKLDVEWFDFAPSLADYMKAADLIISHAGSGSLFEALRLRKVAVAVPNPILMHNHQAELAGQLAEDGYLACATTSELLSVLQSLDHTSFKPYPAGNPADLTAHIDKLMGFA